MRNEHGTSQRIVKENARAECTASDPTVSGPNFSERRCPHCDTQQFFEVQEAVGSIKGSRTVRCINASCGKPFFVCVAGEFVTGPLSQSEAQT
jgi:hypothetical protein